MYHYNFIMFSINIQGQSHPPYRRGGAATPATGGIAPTPPGIPATPASCTSSAGMKDRIGCSSLRGGGAELGKIKSRPLAPTKLHNIKLKLTI